MLESLTIKNFKCFESLQVDGLKPINVIVGLNNSGKTALLEAVHFLTSANLMSSLAVSLGRRGLVLDGDGRAGRPWRYSPEELDWDPDAEFDLRSLFHTSQSVPGAVMSFEGATSMLGKVERLRLSLNEKRSPLSRD